MPHCLDVLDWPKNRVLVHVHVHAFARRLMDGCLFPTLYPTRPMPSIHLLVLSVYPNSPAKRFLAVTFPKWRIARVSHQERVKVVHDAS